MVRYMQFLRAFPLVILSLSFVSCSSIRLQYDADVQTKDGKAGQFHFEKSYNVGGGQPLWCGLSFIFFGGACWYYLVMPTVPEKHILEADAEAALQKKLGSSPVSTENVKIDQVSWSNEPPTSELKF